MQYTRLITSLIEECCAASLGGYDVEDVIAGKATGGDLIREILVRTVCDPRFKGTVRVARAWQDDAHDLLEEFAQGLMDTRSLSYEDALERMEQFLQSYFFTMVQGVSSPNKGAGLVGTGSGGSGKGDGGDGDSGEKDGEGGGDADESAEKGGVEDGSRQYVSARQRKKDDAEKSRLLNQAVRDFDEGPEEQRGRRPSPDSWGRGDGNALSREDEQKAELRFLRSIPSSLRKLASLIGRSGDMDMIPSGHFLSASKSDIAGITVGDNLSSVLPSEIALLGSPATEDIFLRNYAAKRLQVFASASSGGKDPVRHQQGPVAICLDRSGSMEGRPSHLARALTMAVTIIAKREHREVLIVKYGDAGCYELFRVKNLRRQRRDLVRFLTYSCNGGNDEDAMFRALFTTDLPADKAFDSADVLCVSDFGWSPVEDEAMAMISANKAKGMKFYGLDISGEGIRNFQVPEFIPKDGAFPPQIIDSMWVWDEKANACYEEEQKQNGKIR